VSFPTLQVLLTLTLLDRTWWKLAKEDCYIPNQVFDPIFFQGKFFGLVLVVNILTHGTTRERASVFKIILICVDKYFKLRLSIV